ncbi:MAG TPA: L,D-transpeptidase family protein [Alphaproteobacteria bacterium]|nr:L,D-transpeptidase family protein [Alphaproteobacteria bacterium]
MTKKLSLFLFTLSIFIGAAKALPDPAQDSRVQKVYNERQNQLIWIKNGVWTPCAKTLFETLAHAEEEGLWAQDYTPFVEVLKKADLSSLEAQKKADELLTLAVLNYISDIKGERLRPHEVSKNIYLPKVSIDEAELLNEYLSRPQECAWVQELAPSSPEYQHLKKLLALYRQKQAKGGWPELPKNTTLKKGDTGPEVDTLRAQLIAQDVLSPGEEHNDTFDETLEEAVKKYQSLHGLEQDGKVGGSTLTALNTSVEQRIKSIIVSLERYRWYPNPLPSRYLQVNIPGFYLKAVSEGVPAFYMSIITGKEYLKTPVFNALMKGIIFNPAWHVPTSIVNEMLALIRSNPEAYSRTGYHVTHDDSGVHIVQSPGPANSLGRIRFTIESPFSIFLHGTPFVNLFQKTKRALSHGCIRVENPDKLAEFVLNDPEDWPLDRIEEETSKTETKHVKLDQPLQTFITYFTVFEDENHKMNFVEDEYGQDKQVWSALEKAKRNIKE